MPARKTKAIPFARGALCAFLLLCCGCDPVTRHKVLTSVLDGYPALPPVEELCSEHEQRALEARVTQQALPASTKKDAQRSQHRPYQEKRCNDCHRADKGGGGGADDDGLLVKPRDELCFLCHKDLLNGPFQHGPAAVGDCLACHLPHDSQYPSLLVKSKDALCGKCHTEARQAAHMHKMLAEKDLTCTNCHDPHSGQSSYFLK